MIKDTETIEKFYPSPFIPKSNKSFKINKKITFSILGAVLLLSLITAAVVLFDSIPITSTVNEPLSTSTSSLDFSAYPGENVTKMINITNSANVPLTAQLTLIINSNGTNVDYTTNLPLTTLVSPGINSVNVWISYNNSTNIGNLTGSIELSRV